MRKIVFGFSVCLILLLAIGAGFNIHTQTREATFVVASSDSSVKCRASADYVCDGTADHVEIQAAIDALPAVGGVVSLTEGTFNIGVAAAATGIDLVSNMELRMTPGTTLKAVVGVDDGMYILGLDTVVDTIISGGILDGQRASQTQTDNYNMYGILMVDSDRCIIRNVSVKNIGSEGWDDAHGPDDNEWAGYGIYMNSCLYNRILNCYLYGSGRENIVCYDNSNYNYIYGNIIKDSNDRGVVFHTGLYNCLISNFISGANYRQAVHVTTGAHQNTIMGNMITDSNSGIYITTDSNDNLVSNNYITNCGGMEGGGDNGVTLLGDRNIVVANNFNHSTANQIYGIRILGDYATDNYIASNNVIDGGATAGILDAGTTTIIRNNPGYTTTETGTGKLVLQTTPTLTTPVLGVATATTINKVTITAPASGSTLTIADGKTLTVSNDATVNQSVATTSAPTFANMVLSANGVITGTAFGKQHTDSAVTGTTDETTLATIAIAANTLGANGSLRITTIWTYTGSTNSKTFAIYFGGTKFASQATSTETADNLYAITYITNRNNTAVQIGSGYIYPGIGSVNPVDGTVDTTSAQNVTATGKLANTGETITLKSILVEVIK